MNYRKRAAKLAKNVPAEHVETFLKSLNDDLNRVFTIGDLVAYWLEGRGVMLLMEDDEVFSAACHAYLRCRGAPHFVTSAEAERHAKVAGWLGNAAQQGAQADGPASGGPAA